MKTLKYLLCFALLSSCTLLYADNSSAQESKTEVAVMGQNGGGKYVSIDTDSEVTRIIIRKLSGEIVYEKSTSPVETNIDIQGWEKGRYVVTIYHGVQFETKSFSIL